MLCCRILKETKGTSTTKGCATCCVPLCSATSYKFSDPSESCEYRWHNICDLKSLKPAEKTPKKGEKRTITESVQGAVEGLMNMARRQRRKRYDII